MVSKAIPGVGYSVTPEAQAMRRAWLEPERMLAKLRKACTRPPGGMEYVHAIGLIRMTGYLQCPPAEQVMLIERVLDVLDQVTEEEAVTGCQQ
jgi:hypothetical protein